MESALAAINWAEFDHAYGSAEDIPHHLLRLSSDDPDVWVGALDSLQWTVCHQGTIYSATSHTVPFLLQHLQDPAVKCRARILELLADFAQGASYIDVHRELSFLSEDYNSPEKQAEMAEELRWVSETKEEIWKGLETFIDFLTDSSPKLRMSAAFILGCLCQEPFVSRERDAIARLCDALCQRFFSEPAPLLRSGILFALKPFLEQGFVQKELFLSQLRSPASPQEEMAAAVCVFTPEAPQPEAIDVFCRALMNWDATDKMFSSGQASMEDRHHPLYKAYAEAGLPIVETAQPGEDIGEEEDLRFPWLEFQIQYDLIKLLCKVDPAYTERLLPTFKSVLKRDRSFQGDLISEPILDFLFQGHTLPEKPTLSDLNEYQVQALEILLLNEDWYDPTCGGQDEMLRKLGIPDSPWKWPRLLGRPGLPVSSGDQILANLELFIQAQEGSSYVSPIKNTPGEPIRRLDLSGVVDGDVYLPYLNRFPELQALHLWDTDLTDQGLLTIPNIPGLCEIYLGCNPLGDAGLTSLLSFPNLNTLYLSSTHLSDHGLIELLRGLPYLSTLILCHCDISDVSVPELKRTRTLKQLNISYTKISPEGEESLKSALPACKIERSEFPVK